VQLFNPSCQQSVGEALEALIKWERSIVIYAGFIDLSGRLLVMVISRERRQ